MTEPEQIYAFLQKNFPGGTTTSIPEDNPLEIICEIQQTPGADQSLVMVFIKQSEPHFHKKTREEYRVIEGQLLLHIGDQQKLLSRNQYFTIEPHQVHWAQGFLDGEPGFACVAVVAIPAWSKEDHFAVT
jgi:mannose-6-phosphate isomerase-like protein (cupin superfamily)